MVGPPISRVQASPAASSPAPGRGCRAGRPRARRARWTLPLVVLGIWPRRTKRTSASSTPNPSETFSRISPARRRQPRRILLEGLDHHHRHLALGALGHRKGAAAQSAAAAGGRFGQPFDLVRHQVVAAQDQEVLEPAGQVELALVEEAEVPGAQLAAAAGAARPELRRSLRGRRSSLRRRPAPITAPRRSRRPAGSRRSGPAMRSEVSRTGGPRQAISRSSGSMKRAISAAAAGRVRVRRPLAGDVEAHPEGGFGRDRSSCARPTRGGSRRGRTPRGSRGRFPGGSSRRRSSRNANWTGRGRPVPRPRAVRCTAGSRSSGAWA